MVRPTARSCPPLCGRSNPTRSRWSCSSWWPSRSSPCPRSCWGRDDEHVRPHGGGPRSRGRLRLSVCGSRRGGDAPAPLCRCREFCSATTGGRGASLVFHRRGDPTPSGARSPGSPSSGRSRSGLWWPRRRSSPSGPSTASSGDRRRRPSQGDRCPAGGGCIRGARVTRTPAKTVEFLRLSAAHRAVQPPSAARVSPVTKLAASLARNTTGPAISIGSANRSRGVRSTIDCRSRSFS